MCTPVLPKVNLQGSQQPPKQQPAPPPTPSPTPPPSPATPAATVIKTGPRPAEDLQKKAKLRNPLRTDVGLQIPGEAEAPGTNIPF